MAKSIKEQIAAVDEAIAKLNTKRAELVANLGNEVDPDALVVGVQVEFTYGKGETKRTLQGTIVGRKEADPADKKSSALLKVGVGTGFDAQLVTVYPAQVTKALAGEAPQDAPAA